MPRAVRSSGGPDPCSANPTRSRRLEPVGGILKGPVAVPLDDLPSFQTRLPALREAIRAGCTPYARRPPKVTDSPLVWCRDALAVASCEDALLPEDDPLLARASVVLVTPWAGAVAWLLTQLDRAAGSPLPGPALRRIGEAAFWHQEDHPDDASAEGLLLAMLDAASAWARDQANDRPA